MKQSYSGVSNHDREVLAIHEVSKHNDIMRRIFQKVEVEHNSS